MPSLASMPALYSISTLTMLILPSEAASARHANGVTTTRRDHIISCRNSCASPHIHVTKSMSCARETALEAHSRSVVCNGVLTMQSCHAPIILSVDLGCATEMKCQSSGASHNRRLHEADTHAQRSQRSLPFRAVHRSHNSHICFRARKTCVTGCIERELCRTMSDKKL